MVLSETLKLIRERWSELKGGGSSRGQFTIYGVIVTIITLFIYAAFYPLLMDTISSMALTGMEAMLMQLIPFLILLGIALIPLNYSQPQRINYP